MNQVMKELQAGLSIDDVCRKHNLTFKELWDCYHSHDTHKVKSVDDAKPDIYVNNLKEES